MQDGFGIGGWNGRGDATLLLGLHLRGCRPVRRLCAGSGNKHMSRPARKRGNGDVTDGRVGKKRRVRTREKTRATDEWTDAHSATDK